MNDRAMTKKNADDTNEALDVSRRGIAGLFLGVVGAAALAGCAETTSSKEVVGSAAEAASAGSRWFDTILTSGVSFLANTPGVASGEVVGVGGYAAPGDGGGGLFAWVLGDAPYVPTPTPPGVLGGGDGGTTFIPPGQAPASSGYWRRINDGALSVHWFGAKGDNVNNDQPAIQAAIETAYNKGGGTVYLAAGTYKVQNSILLSPHITLRGAAASQIGTGTPTTIYAAKPQNGAFDLSGAGAGGYNSIIHARDRSHVQNYGIRIEDLTVAIPFAPSAYGVTTTGYLAGIDFSSVSWGVIRNVSVIEGALEDKGRVCLRTIGFLFTDDDGTPNGVDEVGSGASTYSNVLEGLGAYNVDWGMKFKSGNGLSNGRSTGQTTLQTVTNFWLSNCNVAIALESGSTFGLSFRDGYLVFASVPPASPETPYKAVSYKGNAATFLDIYWQGIQTEHWPNPPDLPVANGTVLACNGYSEPAVCAVIDGLVALRSTRRIISGAALKGGESASNPVLSTQVRAANWPPPATLSFWAAIPAGTPVVAGANVFTFYTAQNIFLPDLYLACHVNANGGLTAPFALSGSAATMTTFAPYPDRWLTYTITIYVSKDQIADGQTSFVLTQNLTFFLDVNQTTAKTNMNRLLTGYDRWA